VPAPDWFRELLDQELSPSQIEQLHNHYELLLRWNQRMNLTTVEPGTDMVVRHYCESLFFASNIPAGRADISVLDAGSGAGFPGIPLAVLKPQWRVTLVESNQRKAVFLREASRHLSNITVLARRLVDVTSHDDWLVARAVDPREVLANIPRLAPNVGLMLGEADFSAIRSEFPIAWAEPIRLPWGDRRICAFGRST
jgi:16S rRNA (guanine527-N7)-methyltransferase